MKPHPQALAKIPEYPDKPPSTRPHTCDNHQRNRSKSRAGLSGAFRRTPPGRETDDGRAEAAHAPSHTEKSAKSVRFVRFENAQSINPTRFGPRWDLANATVPRTKRSGVRAAVYDRSTATTSCTAMRGTATSRRSSSWRKAARVPASSKRTAAGFAPGSRARETSNGPTG